MAVHTMNPGVVEEVSGLNQAHIAVGLDAAGGRVYGIVPDVHPIETIQPYGA
jgi:hypothetical protein